MGDDEPGLRDWNRIIYKDDDGNRMTGGLDSEEFWNEFKIKSGPKFPDACWSHIPEKWADDVRIMLHEIQSKFEDKVTFAQIKEKCVTLTVYYSAPKELRKEVDSIISACIDRLVDKGIHPEPWRDESNERH